MQVNHRMCGFTRNCEFHCVLILVLSPDYIFYQWQFTSTIFPGVAWWTWPHPQCSKQDQGLTSLGNFGQGDGGEASAETPGKATSDTRPSGWINVVDKALGFVRWFFLCCSQSMSHNFKNEWYPISQFISRDPKYPRSLTSRVIICSWFRGRLKSRST